MSFFFLYSSKTLFALRKCLEGIRRKRKALAFTELFIFVHIKDIQLLNQSFCQKQSKSVRYCWNFQPLSFFSCLHF